MGAFDDLIGGGGAFDDLIPNKSRESGAKAPGAIQGALAALNGLTFGFGDELAGAVRGAYEAATGGKFDEGYQGGRDYVRGAVEGYRKDYGPTLAMLADLSGGMLTAPLGAVGAVGRLGAAGRAASTVGMGAGFGALGGAGNAETMADVPSAAITGGILGGATAGALSAGGAVAGAVGRNVAERMPTSWGGAQAHQAALDKVAQALARDDMTASQLARELSRLGPEATIADAGGKNTLRLLDTMATMPGETANKLEGLIRNRQVTRANRLDAIPDSLGGKTKGDDIFSMLQTIKEESAGPLYEKVDSLTVPITSKLADLSDRPVVKMAIEQARTNVANEGAAAVSAFNDAALTGGQMPLRFWDNVKRGLDDVIGRIKRGQTNQGDSTLRDAVRVKNELVAELDNLTKDSKTGESVYKAARDAFAGPAALQSAIEDGRKALTMSPREIKAATFKMDSSELEAFRLGAADALREKIGTRAGQTNLLNAPTDRNTRMLLNEIFGDTTGYRNAMKIILQEGRLKPLEGAGRGSQTASREAAMDDAGIGFAADMAGAATSAAGGHMSGIFNAAKSLGGRLSMPETVRDEIGKILMLKSGGNLRGTATADIIRKTDEVINLIRAGYSREAAIEAVLGANLLTQ